MATEIPARELVRTQLRRALPRLARLEGFSVALGGEVTHGGTRLVLSELCNLRYDLLRGIAISPGVGLGGLALRYRRPAAVDDYVGSPTITHQFDRAVWADRIQGAIALPVQVNGVLRAVVYGASRTRMTIGERTVAAAMVVVNQLSRDIEVEEEVQARLRRLREELAHRALGDLAPLTTVEVAELGAELSEIATGVADPELRARLDAVSVRLAGGAAPREDATTIRLSRRERDVLVLLSSGCSNQEIGDRLAIRPTTVKTHLKHVMRKLDARNRVEVVAAARRAGLLP